MMDKKTWQEFQQTGLVWWINRQLHLFGWSLVLMQDKDTKEVFDAFPARTSWKGFDRKDEEERFKTLTEYLAANVNDLVKEVNDDNEEKSNED